MWRRSPLVRPAVIDAFAAQAEATMPETVTVQASARVATAAGGQTVTWSTTAVVPGRLRPGGQQPDEVDVGGRYTVEKLWIIAVPAATAVSAHGRLVIGARTFSVVDLLGRHSYSPELRVLCAEVH